MSSTFDFETTSRTLPGAAGALHYHDAGSGPALILLHGSGPGVSGWANFRGNLPVFAQSYRTLILDLPGYGRSDAAAGPAVPACVQAVLRLMDGLGLERAHLLGNSYGGIVGSVLAAFHPARVERFITIGGVGHGLFTAFPGEGINLLMEFTEDPTRERLLAWLRSMVYDPSLITEELVELRYRQAIEPKTLATSRAIYSRAAMKAIAAAARGPDAVQGFAHLPKIQAPTLLTWGRDDRVSPLDRAFIAMRLIPNCELHVFPDCGHWTMIEKKADFESLALSFLKR